LVSGVPPPWRIDLSRSTRLLRERVPFETEFDELGRVAILEDELGGVAGVGSNCPES